MFDRAVRMARKVRRGSAGDTGRHRCSPQAPAHPRAALAARRSVQVVAALVSATLLVAMGYYRYTYTELDRNLHRVGVGGLGPATDSGPSVQHVDGKAQNLLLIGSDSRAGLSQSEIEKLHVGSSDDTTSTDTLLIVHVPANGSRATLISIPRDTYVQIPGFDSNKINAAFVDGYNYGTDGYPVSGSSSADQRQAAGLTLLVRVVKNLTGLEIDHYALVNFLGFYRIAQAIGGITVDLCHAVNDTGRYNREHGEGEVGSGFVSSAGVHHLDPVQALQFVRQRHNLVDSAGHQLNDQGREARQRYFLAAAFKEIASADTLVDPGKLRDLIDAVRATLTIDDGLSLPSLAHQLVDLSGSNIRGQTIPTQGTRTYPSPVGDALVVDVAKVRAQVAHWLSAVATSPTRSPAPSTSAPSSAAATSPKPSSTVPQADKGCIN